MNDTFPQGKSITSAAMNEDLFISSNYKKNPLVYCECRVIPTHKVHRPSFNEYIDEHNGVYSWYKKTRSVEPLFLNTNKSLVEVE